MDDVDRIFQRSNYDASDGSRGARPAVASLSHSPPRRGRVTIATPVLSHAGSRRGNSVDRTQIAMSAEEALDELSRTGCFVETDPGETNLREKL